MDNLIHENVVVSIKNISPANAAKILDAKNIQNRSISKTKVYEYTKAMRNGDWLFNGDSIRVSSEGVLLDGQHRLTALVKSNTSQYFVVIENMHKEVGLTIDTGKNRSGGDVLSLELGVKKGVAAVISGAIKIFYRHGIGKTFSNTGTDRLSNVQIIEQYKQNKELVNYCVNWMDENISKQGAILQKSEMLGLLMILSDIDQDECATFCEMVFCGLGINNVCSQSHLRDYLLLCKSKMKPSTQTQRLHTIIKVWNSVRSGRDIKNKSNIIFKSGRDVFKQAY